MTVIVVCASCGEDMDRLDDGTVATSEISSPEPCGDCRLNDFLFDEGADARHDPPPPP